MTRRIDQETGIEWLSRDRCLELLADDSIGRLAIVVGRTPTILPVNYALDGEVVVFRSDHGSKVEWGPRSPAAFEIDHFDRETRSGWSVVVTGRLEEPAPFDTATRDRLAGLAVEPWAGGPKDHWMCLVPSRITGRRLGGSPPPSGTAPN